jgi:hypothetical protein
MYNIILDILEVGGACYLPLSVALFRYLLHTKWRRVLIHAYTIVITFDSSLNHTLTEVPFESGKVVGLWYVGNTVYTVGRLFYTFWMKVASIKIDIVLFFLTLRVWW